ncbi:MAG TPA: hypothetical protein VN932_06160 [Rhizomicrobium sp.]|nr:hypothetical protein [Rhizomicrobium sp.]
MTAAEPQDIVVQEAIGPSLGGGEAAAAIALGVISLLLAGVLPALLGALADEGRISNAGIGQCATLEGLSMALSTALVGILVKPQRLRLIGAVAAAVLVILDFATMRAHGTSVFVIRAAAGVPEGVLLWLVVSMIVRSEVPERWAGVFFTSLVAAQLALALAFALFVIPRWGADGGFAALALATLPAVFIALRAPDRYAALPKPAGESGAPPLRGWIALLATLIFAAAPAAVGVYLQPLAHQAGLSADIARTALWVSLAAQVAGGAMATALAGRVHYLAVFVFSTLCFLAAWAVFMIFAPAALFIAANGLAGLVTVLAAPFLVPMTIEADPSRRAAVQSAGTQVLAGAFGPLFASFLVAGSNVHGVLAVGAGLLLGGLAIIAGLHVVALRERWRVAS